MPPTLLKVLSVWIKTSAILALAALPADAVETNPVYSPCPLIGAYYPPPVITREIASNLSGTFTGYFDKLVHDGGSADFGPISPNTTSFAVAFFSGSDTASGDSTFFEYYHTAPCASSRNKTNVDRDTRFPVGDVTMVFTVYSWLVRMGEQWDAPITKFLPELDGKVKNIPWKDVTIGALAGHMSGLARESHACSIAEPCSRSAFLSKISNATPLFLPDTTPTISYTSFQLLALAMERASGGAGGKTASFADSLRESVLAPLNMTQSAVLSHNTANIFGGRGLNTSQHGEPAALSLVSTTRDLARAGRAMLSSRQVSPAVTRRWLHSHGDTSNLRNGVGRPWEVYRAGGSAISPIIDVSTKSGALGPYASYFGLAPDFDVGFAILAHDKAVPERGLDLNVYVDVVSGALASLQGLAAKQTAARYAGRYGAGNGSTLVVGTSKSGPGLEVTTLEVGGVDVKAQTASKMGIKRGDLDYRLYPTNVRDGGRHQFVAVLQDKAAPVDMGTPTCITWQEVGAVEAAPLRFVFELGEGGVATAVRLPEGDVGLSKTG